MYVHCTDCNNCLIFLLMEQLCREIIKFLLYRGEVKFIISRKSCCTQSYRLFEYQVNDGKKSATFQ